MVCAQTFDVCMLKVLDAATEQLRRSGDSGLRQAISRIEAHWTCEKAERRASHYAAWQAELRDPLLPSDAWVPTPKQKVST